MISVKCRMAFTVFIAVSLQCQLSHGQVQGFIESFDGTGEYLSNNVVIDGFDNDGWFVSGMGGIENEGFSVDLRTQPEQASITVLSRGGFGTGSFRERVELRDLRLGDVTVFDSPDSTSSIALWAYIGEEAVTCSIGKTLGDEPSTSKTTAHCSTPLFPHEPNIIEVPEGVNVSLELDVNVEAGWYVFRYDPDVNDDAPAIEIGPIVRTFPEASTYYTLVRLVAGGQGTVQGRVDNWTLLPDSPVIGDFGGNGYLDVSDVVMLTHAIIESSHDVRFDVTSDQFVDQRDLTYWLHNLKNSYHGDSNLDGEFNSADLINAFQAGEYEDDVVGNSIWSTGDWDADGEFTTGDLVIAFQDGGYEKGPRATLASVPEPNAMLLSVAFGVFAGAKYRRTPLG